MSDEAKYNPVAKEAAEGGVVKRTYAQILELGEKAIETIKLPFKVREAKNKLSGEIIRIEGEIAEADLKIVETKGSHPLDLESILECINNKELKERQLKQANELMEELFPEN